MPNFNTITQHNISKNQSSEKLLKLIEFLAVQDEPLRLIDISKALNMNSSTVLRFLNALMDMNYLIQDPASGKYYLTFKIAALGQIVKSHQQLSKIAHPLLFELSKRTGETTCLAINQDNQVIYIDICEGPQQYIKQAERVGHIAPLHCTGIGKLFLTTYSDAQIENLISQRGLPAFTIKTITTKESLMEEIEITKERGYAYDNEECDLGIRCISFPIYNYTNQIIAGFSVTGPSSRLTNSFFHQYIPDLKELSTKLSSLMGYKALPSTFTNS